MKFLYLSLNISPEFYNFVIVLPLIPKNLAALLAETKQPINLNPSDETFSYIINRVPLIVL